MDEADSMPASTDAVPALARIRARSASLGVGDRKVAHAVLDLGVDVCYRSIGEVAVAARVAESTVVRACRRLGFAGFQDLKLAVARGAGTTPGWAADEDEGTLGSVLAASARVIEEAVSTVDPAIFTQLVNLLAASGTVVVTGSGGSVPTAQDAALRLRSIGLRCDAPPDEQAQQLAARLLAPGDTCIAMSHSGATRAILDCVESARLAGATTAAITSFDRCPLARAADLVLVAGGRGSGYRNDAMASRFAHLAVVDALYTGVAIARGNAASEVRQLSDEIAAQHQQ